MALNRTMLIPDSPSNGKERLTSIKGVEFIHIDIKILNLGVFFGSFSPYNVIISQGLY